MSRKFNLKASKEKYHEGEEYLEHVKVKDVTFLKRQLKKLRNKNRKGVRGVIFNG